MTILCIWLGFKVHRVKQQREAVAWVAEHGGLLFYDYEVECLVNRANNLPASLTPGPNWLRDLVGVDYLASPVHLQLPRSVISEDLTPLQGLRQLRTIDLSWAATEAEIEKVRQAVPWCREMTSFGY